MARYDMEYFQIESYESFLRKNDEITDYCTEQKPCEVLGTKLQSSKQYVVGSDVTIRLYQGYIGKQKTQRKNCILSARCTVSNYL